MVLPHGVAPWCTQERHLDSITLTKDQRRVLLRELATAKTEMYGDGKARLQQGLPQGLHGSQSAPVLFSQGGGAEGSKMAKNRQLALNIIHQLDDLSLPKLTRKQLKRDLTKLGFGGPSTERGEKSAFPWLDKGHHSNVDGKESLG